MGSTEISDRMAWSNHQLLVLILGMGCTSLVTVLCLLNTRTKTSWILETGIADNHQTITPLRVFYNRVPKCGSRAVHRIFQLISSRNRFHAIASTDYTHRKINESEEFQFVHHLNHQLKTPFVYDRHLHFVNFSTFDEEWPMYINIIREPLSRAVSRFYYNQYGTKRPKFDEKNVTFEGCFDNNLTFVRDANVYCELLDGDDLLPFFCGHSDLCSPDHDYQTLAIAKSNVERHYSVVGLSEDMLSFFRVLATITPRYFRKAHRAYASMNATLYRMLSNKHQHLPPQRIVDHWRKLAAPEYEFYDFIKKRFYDQMRSLGLSRYIT